MNRGLFQSLTWFGVVTLLIANTWTQWPFAVRFMYSPFNHWVLALLLLSFPITAIFLGISIKPRIFGFPLIVMGGLLLVPLFFISSVVIIAGGFKTDSHSFELRNSFTSGFSNYRVYLDTYGGAFVPPSLELRQEIDTPIGIKFVRRIWGGDGRTDDVQMRIVNQSILEVFTDNEVRAKISI